MAGKHLLSRLAVLGTVGFSLACLGSGSDGSSAPNEDGFWNNFVDEHRRWR